MSREYHGSRAKNRACLLKPPMLLIVLLLLAIGTAGGTLAFLTTRTTPVVNTFTPGEVSCRIVENVTDGIKSSVKVKNAGNIDAYIRVAVVANTVDAEGNITGAADDDILRNALAASGWTKGADGYYYHNGVVAPNALTTELLSNPINLSGVQVTILASAIQSIPDDAVKGAWHMSYDNGAWTVEN